MRHFLFLAVALLGGYFGWVIADRRTRRIVVKNTKRHTIPVLLILLSLFAALAFMFYNRSINLL